jgi:hypothetical protein
MTSRRAQTVGHVHRDSADGVFAHVLRDFENHSGRYYRYAARSKFREQFALFELNVDDRAQYLGYGALRLNGFAGWLSGHCYYS